MGRTYDLLVRARGETKDAEKAMAQLQSSIAGAGQKMKDAGKTLTRNVTLPLLTLGAFSVKASNDVSTSMANIRTGTGATGDQLKALGDDFKSVAKQVPQDIKLVASTITDLNKRTGATGGTLRTLSKQMLDLADMTGGDVNEIIRQSTRVFGDWGVKVQEQSGKLDYLFKVTQQTGIKMPQLAEGLVKFGAPLRQMGFDLDTSAALLGKFEQAGVNTQLVLGSMRIALGRMSKAGVKDTDEGLRLIVERIKEAGSAGEANKLAIESFGSKAGPDMAAAIREGRFEIDGLEQSLDASRETIAKADKDSETFGERLQEMGNRAKLAAAPFGDTLIPILDWVGTKLIGVAERFEKMSSTQRTVILIAAGVAAALGPILIVAGQMVISFSALLPVIVAVGGAFKAMGLSVLASNPPLAALAAALAGIAIVTAVVVAKTRDSTAEFYKSTAAVLAESNAIRGLHDAKNQLAGATLSAKEAALSEQQARANYRQIAAAEGKDSLAAQAAYLALQRAKLANKQASEGLVTAQSAEKKALREVRADQITAIQTLQQKKNAEKELANATKAAINAKTTTEMTVGSQRVAAAKKNLANIEKAEGDSISTLRAQLKAGHISRKQIIEAGLGEELGLVKAQAPKSKAAGAATGKALADGVKKGFLDNIGGLIADVEREVAKAAARGNQAGRSAIDGGSGSAGGRKSRSGKSRGLGGFQGTGIDAFGGLIDIIGGTKKDPIGISIGLDKIMQYIEASTGDAFTVSTGADGKQTAIENKEVTDFLKYRVSASKKRIDKLMGARNTALGSLKKARATVASKAAALGRARKSKGKNRATAISNAEAAYDKAVGAVGALEGTIESYEQEILQLGGQIKTDEETLTPPTFDDSGAATSTGTDTQANAERDAENFRRRALGLKSVEEEIELARANEIRAQYGLPAVASMSEIGSNPTTASPQAPQAVQGSNLQPLLASSPSALAAIADSVARAMAGSGGNTFHITSGDPNAVANRVAFIMSNRMLRAGGSV